VFLAIIVAATFGIVYYAYASGLLAEDNPQIPRQMITRINIEREANNLPPVQLSQDHTNDAIKVSRVARISPRGYLSDPGSTNAEDSDIFVIPKTTWAISGDDSQQQLFTSFENDDSLFRIMSLTVLTILSV
jgi:hypothetical protein